VICISIYLLLNPINLKIKLKTKTKQLLPFFLVKILLKIKMSYSIWLWQCWILSNLKISPLSLHNLSLRILKRVRLSRCDISNYTREEGALNR